MYNKNMHELGSAPSAIRELFAYGLQRKKEIGNDNVYDFSIGNPSVPAPKKVAHMIKKLADMDPSLLHAYSEAQGLESTRQAIANNLNKRYRTTYSAENFYLSTGAASCLSCCFKALSNPGDEIIVIAPYFPEYKVFIENAGAICIEVSASSDNFQIDIASLSRAITSNTKAIVVNSPNNPVGTVYSYENLKNLANLLNKKQKEYNHSIYLISDEPYREIVYDIDVPWIPFIYQNTLVCYSWSKSLSLPGDRIGYVLVPDTMPDWKNLWLAIAGAGRSLGYICAPVFFQRVIENCLDEPTDVETYAQNREDFTQILDDLGYNYIQPDGAFYLWIQALEPDAKAFSDKAKKYELLLVPSDSFGVSGWIRAGYCIPNKTIQNSKKSFAKLKEEYNNHYLL